MQKTILASAEEAGVGKPQSPPMDKALHASIGRLTAGVSPAALSLASTDWFQHLAASPDKQLELANAAAANLMRILGEAAQP